MTLRWRCQYPRLSDIIKVWTFALSAQIKIVGFVMAKYYIRTDGKHLVAIRTSEEEALKVLDIVELADPDGKYYIEHV